MLNLFVKATSIRVEEGVFHDKETESVLEDKNLTDSEISQELIDKDNPTENVKPSEIDFTLLGDLAGLSKEAKEEAVVAVAK